MTTPDRVQQALEHPCPKCHAPAGFGCVRPSGRSLPDGEVHAPREAVAARLVEDDGPPAAIATNAGRTVWRDCAKTLRERNDWSPRTKRILLAGVRWLEAQDTAMTRAEEEPEVVGSTGQLQANPSYRVAAAATDKMLACFARLKLTPDTQVGVSGDGRGAPAGDDFDDLDAEAARGVARSG